MAARLTAGLSAGPYGPTGGPYDAPPDDTGEAMDLPPAGLTITIGFGRSLFVGPVGAPVDRFGLADRLPTGLVVLPHFPGDDLDPAALRRRPRRPGLRRRPAGRDARGPEPDPGGVRLGAHPLVAARLRAHLVDVDRAGDPAQPARVQGRHGQRQGRGDRRRRAARLGAAGRRERERAGRLARGRHVPRGPADPDGHRDLGPVGAARAGADHRPDQGRGRAAVGRHASSRSPTSARPARDGAPLIAADSHVRLAHPSLHGGARMLRRGYNFTDGNDRLGRLDAGLFFAAFVRDPADRLHPDPGRPRADGRPARVPGPHGVRAVRGAARRAVDRADGTLVGDDYLGAGLFA